MRLRGGVLFALAMLLGPRAAHSDVVVVYVPPAAAARGLPLQVGDVLRADTDAAQLDVLQLLELETVDAARGPVRLRRVRGGSAPHAIELPAGRWDVIAAPLAESGIPTTDLNAALAHAIDTRDRQRAGELLLARSRVAAAKRDFDAATRDSAAASALLPAHADWIEHVQTLNFENHPDRTRALSAATRAVELRRTKPVEKVLLAYSLQSLAHARAQSRDNDGAVDAAVEAVRLAPDTLVAANAHFVRAFVAMRTSRHDIAGRELDAAARIVERIAPSGLDHATLLSRRAVFSAIKRKGDTATRLYAQALSRLQLLVPDSMLLGRVAFNAHLHALERRRYAEAETQARASMRAFEAAAPAGLEVAQARAALAEVLMRRTQYAQAEALLRVASAASDVVDARSYEALSLKLQLGDSLARQMRHAEALALYDAIDATLAVPDAPTALAETSIAADTALYRGEVLSRLERCPEAIAAATRALDRYVALGRSGTTRWESHLLLSDCRRRGGDVGAALAHAQQALDGFRELGGDGIQVAQAQFAVARAQRDAGRRSDAIEAYRAAIDGLEAHRERVGGNDEIRARWAAQFQDFYKELLWLEAGGGTDDAVIEIEARYREQALLQLLGEGHADLAPNWAGLAPTGSFRAAALPADTALLSYVVGGEGTLVILLLPGDLQPVVVRLPATRTSLDVLVDRMLLLAARDSRDPAAVAALRDVAHSLHTALIAPLMPSVARFPRWIVVADGALLQLPWPALVVRNTREPRYLVEERVLSVVPSAPVWAVLSQRARAPASMFAFADPGAVEGEATQRGVPAGRLPGARREVQALSDAFPDRVITYFGANATEARVRLVAPRAGVLHFALHSVTDARAPMASHIVLAGGAGTGKDNDGRLRADEIAREVKLVADLVVLSSCASARGLDAGGEGLLGLTRALHLAGARAVIGTHWPVADQSTARLMRDFYRHRSAGLPSDTALSAAQRDWLAAARKPDWRRALERVVEGEDAQPPNAAHPFFWAGFMHSGAAAR